jgi:hypothetical protein
MYRPQFPYRPQVRLGEDAALAGSFTAVRLVGPFSIFHAG